MAKDRIPTKYDELTDKQMAILDAALDAAEAKLEKLLAKSPFTGTASLTPSGVVAYFREHSRTHLAFELRGAMKYGNSVKKFRAAIMAGKESAI